MDIAHRLMLRDYRPLTYYNEIDQYAARWLRNLMRAELISPGRVDMRDIRDVTPKDPQRAGASRCHFFAGIAGWEYALQLAGWPSDVPVWTGSCPCQPFSTAGKRKGTKDDRHLWPEFRRLIAECAPPVVFGEQVASKAGRDWLATVRSDLENLGYEVGAADLCAASAGAPHIRQRFFWVASQRLGDTDGYCIRRVGTTTHRSEAPCGHESERNISPASGVVGDPWSHAEWISCYDPRIDDAIKRPIEPSIEPLADGAPNAMGRLRAYGNAIVPQVAAIFIRSVMDYLDASR